MLKHLDDSVLIEILALFNSVWKEGKLPVEWKHAVVVPVLNPDILGKDCRMSGTRVHDASKQKMEKPLQLVYNEDGNLGLNPEALKVLKSIEDPMVVVAVVGAARTGKSYLMNCLAGDKTGFSMDSTTQAHTKGIWMWFRSLPQRPNEVLLLLDTEGLGDPEKGDINNDNSIYLLAILLSSILIYNGQRNIDQQSLQDLHFVTELSKWILMKSQPDGCNSWDFVRFFPEFLWVIRDLTLDLSVEGKDATPIEYLEHILKLKGRFVELTETYVGMMVDGILPCVESCVAKLMEKENQAAVVEALKFFDTEIEKFSESGCVTVNKLIENYNMNSIEAFNIFHKRSMNNNSGKYIQQLEEKMSSTYKSLVVKIKEKLEEECETHLKEVMSSIKENLTSGHYLRPGGFQELKENLDKAIKEYKERTKNEMEGWAVLTHFLEEEKARLDHVQEMDSKLTAEQMRVSALEQELSRVKQEMKMMEQKRKVFEECRNKEIMEQIRKRFEEGKTCSVEELKEAKEHMMSEMKKYEVEGRMEDAQRALQRYEYLKKKYEETKKWSFTEFIRENAEIFATLVTVLGTIAQVIISIARK
ncbi:guanylate-binding protein 1-like isoform X4 [Mobula birostris]|uniref:guanylate-binding protein 1-like isoform X4 n=1 Tax=Mobula birostris TaxID=1983395 RepID=UPI003B27E4CF